MKDIEQTSREEPNNTASSGNDKRSVHWASTVKDNEKKSKKLLLSLDKGKEDEVREYIIKQFKDKKHEEFKKELLDNYTSHERAKIFSVKEYSPIKWPCVHGDIEALKLIVKVIPVEKLEKMISCHDYQPFRFFLIYQEDVEKDEVPYNKQERIEGIKLLYQINSKAFTKAIDTSEYTTENIRKDFQTAIEELRREVFQKENEQPSSLERLSADTSTLNRSFVETQKARRQDPSTIIKGFSF